MDIDTSPADEFASSIRARRFLLQTLFYATRNSAADAWSFYQQRESLKKDKAKSGATNFISDIFLGVEQTHAEATAQDSALALLLILDYALRRLGAAAKIDTRTLGAELDGGVKLNAAIWAVANQARHFHGWASCDATTLDENPSVLVIKRLKLDPLNLNAARELLCTMLPVESYIDLEALLLKTAPARVPLR